MSDGVTAEPDTDVVSVVIPCFNQARFLGDALASIARQSYPQREVIVVDDGSTDDPGTVARVAGARLIQQDNRGTAAARNRGFAESRGAYVVFLDADDRLLPGALQAGVEALQAHPECGFVYGHVRILAASSAGAACPPQTAVVGGHYRELLSHNYIWTPGAVMYRRAVIKRVGGFDPRAGGSADFDLNIRIARTWAIRCHGCAVLEYREHPTSQSADIALMLRSAVAVRRRHRRHVRDSPPDRAALEAGIRLVQADYGERLLDRLAGHVRAGSWRLALRCLPPLLRYHPGGLVRRVTRKLR